LFDETLACQQWQAMKEMILMKDLGGQPPNPRSLSAVGITSSKRKRQQAQLSCRLLLYKATARVGSLSSVALFMP